MINPDHQPPSSRQVQKGSSLSTFLVAMLVIATTFGLLFLTLGFFRYVVLIGGAIFALVAFHYFVWGWWLGGVIQQEVEAEERQQREDEARRRAD